jgi:hypothetical protein
MLCCFKPRIPEASGTPATVAASASQVETREPEPVIAPANDHGAHRIDESPAAVPEAPETEAQPQPQPIVPSEADAPVPEPSPPVEPVQPLKVTRAKVRRSCLLVPR